MTELPALLEALHALRPRSWRLVWLDDDGAHHSLPIVDWGVAGSTGGAKVLRPILANVGVQPGFKHAFITDASGRCWRYYQSGWHAPREWDTPAEAVVALRAALYAGSSGAADGSEATQRWMADCCEQATGMGDWSAGSSLLFSSWFGWCEVQGERPGPRPEFHSWLKRKNLKLKLKGPRIAPSASVPPAPSYDDAAYSSDDFKFVTRRPPDAQPATSKETTK